MLSCSSDDSSSNNPNRTLVKSTFFSTLANAEVGIKSNERIFDNERQTSLVRFSGGEESDKNIFSYNNDGLLASEMSEFKNFDGTDVKLKTTYTYDNQNRIVKIESQSNIGGSSETIFTYNEDGTINEDNGLFINTYFTNNQGVIFKSSKNSIEGRMMTEIRRENTAEFNGNLITKITHETFENQILTDTQIETYIYDETVPKLIPTRFILDQFGMVNNIFLIRGFSLIPTFSYSEKLVSKTITVNSRTGAFDSIRDYVNTFDSDGYLIQTEEFYFDRRASFNTYEYN